MNTRFALTKVLLASALLGGCWGDDDDPPVPPPAATEVPASAGATPEAYVAYAQTLPAEETPTEPLGLDLIAAAPVSETDDPVPLN